MLYVPIHIILDLLSLCIVREKCVKNKPDYIYRIPLEDMRDYMSNDTDGK